MSFLLGACALAAVVLGSLALLHRAYARHASRRVLAALGIVSAALAFIALGTGQALIAASVHGKPFSVEPATFAAGLLLSVVGVVVPVLLARSLARIRTPAGAMRVAPGDMLPPLPVRALDGAELDAATLRGPGGTLLVWYRGLT